MSVAFLVQRNAGSSEEPLKVPAGKQTVTLVPVVGSCGVTWALLQLATVDEEVLLDELLDELVVVAVVDDVEPPTLNPSGSGAYAWGAEELVWSVPT